MLVNAILLQFISLLITGCQTVEVNPSRDSSSMEITVRGVGIDKEKALEDAFRNAVEIISGTYIYSESKVSNFQLIKDEIATHSKGFIKSYEIIYEQKIDLITTLSVKCVVSKDPIKSIIRKRNLKTWDDTIGDLAIIQQTQARLRESVKLLKTFMGTDANETFKKAYQADIIGYTIESIGLNQVEGHILAQLALNTAFWEQYSSILEEVAIRGNSNTLVKTIPVGLYNGAYHRKYNAPLDLQKYFLPEFSIYYYYPERGMEVLRKLELDNNIISPSRAIFHYGFAPNGFAPTYHDSAGEWTPGESFYGIKKSEFYPLIPPGQLSGRAGYFVLFKDSIIIKIPFSVTNETEIKQILSQKIPWKILSGAGYMRHNARDIIEGNWIGTRP